MKRSLLIIGLCLVSLAHQSYGQTQATSKESVPVAVAANAELSQKRAELDAKQIEMNRAVSREQLSKLNDELQVLKKEYVRLLQVEADKSTDTNFKTQLQNEISRYSEVSNTQNR